MYPTITIFFGHLPQAPGRMSLLLKCGSANLRYFVFFLQSQACAGSIPKSKFKSKISPSLIYMGFIGFVKWLGGKRTMKERIREAQKVFKDYTE